MKPCQQQAGDGSRSVESHRFGLLHRGMTDTLDIRHFRAFVRLVELSLGAIHHFGKSREAKQVLAHPG
jgi:hypothetical protein